MEFEAWARSYIGDGQLEMLRELHNTICKRSKSEREDMYKHFVTELDKLHEARDRGEEYQPVDWD